MSPATSKLYKSSGLGAGNSGLIHNGNQKRISTGKKMQVRGAPARSYSPGQALNNQYHQPQPSTGFTSGMAPPPFLTSFNPSMPLHMNHAHPALMINGSIFSGSSAGAPGTFSHHFMNSGVQPGHLGNRGVSPYSGTRATQQPIHHR